MKKKNDKKKDISAGTSIKKRRERERERKEEGGAEGLFPRDNFLTQCTVELREECGTVGGALWRSQGNQGFKHSYVS